MDGAAIPDSVRLAPGRSVSGQSGGGHSAEAVLRAELAAAEPVRASIGPVLRHLIGQDDHALFADEIVARVRGMVEDVAFQLTAEMGEGHPGDREPAVSIEALSGILAANPAFLAHLHALAFEWRLTQRLQEDIKLDPVLSPLLQALIGSADAGTAALSMNLLAAQARFGQSQRRMKLPLAELPGDLLHAALLALRTLAGTDPVAADAAEAAEASLRARFDEGASRLGLISRVVTGMGGGAVAALSVSHAGAAIFLTALALASGQDRDLAALAAGEKRIARLALSLRAAGLKPRAVEEQCLLLQPDAGLPAGFEELGSDRAAALLAMGGSG